MHWKGFVTWLLQQSMSSVLICRHHLPPVCHTQLQTQRKFRQSPKDITPAGGGPGELHSLTPPPGCPTMCTHCTSELLVVSQYEEGLYPRCGVGSAWDLTVMGWTQPEPKWSNVLMPDYPHPSSPAICYFGLTKWEALFFEDISQCHAIKKRNISLHCSVCASTNGAGYFQGFNRLISWSFWLLRERSLITQGKQQNVFLIMAWFGSCDASKQPSICCSSNRHTSRDFLM